MISVALVYFTHTDITGHLVEASASAIEASGAHAYVHRIVGSEIVEGRFQRAELFNQLAVCEAIIFASPTYMGGPAAQFKAFADASGECWADQLWAGKVAAGITSGTSKNGDQTATLQYFSLLASQHGMVWVGLDKVCGDQGLNRLGSQLGVVAEANDGEVNNSDLETAAYLGRRVAATAGKMRTT